MKMIKYLFRQALAQLKQQPLLTIVSVFGTALTICLIMVMVMQQQIKVVPFAPESNRDRLLHISWLSMSKKSWGADDRSDGALSYQTAKNCFKDLSSAEAVSIHSIVHEPMQIRLPLSPAKAVDIKHTDALFFKIFDFSFIDGKPFAKAEADAGLPVAVITETVARFLFDTAAATGKEMLINDVPFRVVGVVKDVSSLASTAYAQVWIPLLSTQITTSLKSNWADGHMGLLRVVILAKQKSDFEAIRTECDRKVKDYNASIGDWVINLREQPDNQIAMSQRKWASHLPDMKTYYRNQLIMILILLLVPAINLSSMTQSRLRQRVAEVGVRRSFGATKGEIMGQIVAENLVLTLIASFVGLAMCLTFATVWGSSLFAESSMIAISATPQVEWQMLFKVSTFIYALLFSLVLNLLSSGLPAWKASKIPIVNALTGKTHSNN